MKALTISQPFASLIASGEKGVENRRWPTRHRGPIAIHAGKGTQYLTRLALADYPTGCVIAIAQLVACVRWDDLTAERQPAMRALFDAGVLPNDVIWHEYTEGPWCWVLRGVCRIKPVKCAGMPGLWEWDNDASGT
jgi:hypothetical protein